MELCDSDLKKLCKQDVTLTPLHINTLLYNLLAGSAAFESLPEPARGLATLRAWHGSGGGSMKCIELRISQGTAIYAVCLTNGIPLGRALTHVVL